MEKQNLLKNRNKAVLNQKIAKQLEGFKKELEES